MNFIALLLVVAMLALLVHAGVLFFVHPLFALVFVGLCIAVLAFLGRETQGYSRVDSRLARQKRLQEKMGKVAYTSYLRRRERLGTWTFLVLVGGSNLVVAVGMVARGLRSL